jgi:signal transduction histidine kinase
MSRMVRRDVTSRDLLIDTLIALFLTALSVFAVVVGAGDLGPAGPLNVVLLLLQTVPLALRRVLPIAVLAIVFGAIAIQVTTIAPGAELRSTGGPLVAMYTIGERVQRRWGIPLLVGVLVMLGISMLYRVALPRDLQAFLQTELFIVAAWYMGDLVRIRSLYTRAVEERAGLLEREREERARTAILEERQRISRELHDAVTHHVSVIVIQAGAALRALGRRPDDVRGALEAIDSTGRQALTDMRRMLGMLGSDAGQEPAPGLDRLGDLIEKMRRAGLAVELSLRGTPRPLDPGLELSAYRIIQEGLTNSLKHARGGRACVTVVYTEDVLEISIDDERGSEADAPPVESTHEGRGLVGMRERVAMFRGSFAAQPTATGFRVMAQLPLEDRISAA